MDRRGLTGVIAVLGFVVLVGALAYFDAYTVRQSAPTAAVASGEAAPPPAADAAAPAPDTMASNAPDAGAAAGTGAAGTGAAGTAGAAAPPPADVAMGNASDTAPAANPPAMPGPPQVPTFDVVRVEPTGDAVIAGEAAPDSKVEVLDGTTTIATAESNENGEWAMALDKPLPPGTHDLSLRTTSKDDKVATLSDERVTVSVPEPGSKDVLVVVNTPDAASRVLEVPAGEAAKPGEQTAAASPPATEEAKPGEQVATAEPPAATGAPAATTEAAKPGEEVAAAPPAEGTAPPAEGTKPAEETAAAAAPAETAKPGEEVATAEAAKLGEEVATAEAAKPGEEVATAEPSPVGEAPIATEPPPASEPQIALESPVPAEPAIKGEPPLKTEAPVKVEPPLGGGEGTATETEAKPEPEPPAPKPTPEVAVAAVEADTAGSVYIAGTVSTPETVRVYIDDKPVGDARPSPSGTWLIETKRDMPAGKYTVRVDQLDEGGNVIARSEVPFEREVEVAILKPTGTAGAGAGGATLSGAMPMETVIIKRGDNLWHIARGAWGKGVRWSTIYQANTDQIRNPHWIYPGQVFIMPKGNTAWTD